GPERLQTRNVADIRIDRAVLRVNGEEHGALEAVMLGQNPAELRQGLLRAILLIATDQHDMLALAGAFEAVVDDPGIVLSLCSGVSRTNEAESDHRGDCRPYCNVHGFVCRSAFPGRRSCAVGEPVGLESPTYLLYAASDAATMSSCFSASKSAAPSSSLA